MTEDTHVQLQIMTDTALKFKKQLEQTCTLRDRFAMAALSAIIQGKDIHTTTQAAETAYHMADSMMEARK